MAGMGAGAPVNGAAGTKSGGGGVLLAVIYVTALFFIWAFVTNLIDPLVKSMKVVYTLTDFETQLNQFAFFIAYGVMSIPSGAYLAKNGYAKSIILGLIGIVVGCLIAWSTTFSHNFITVLLGLFVAASGITLLQVAANPLIASMGDPKESHFRLNLSQAFNSMGAYLGGIFGARFLLQGPLFEQDVVITETMKTAGLGFVTNVYLMIAGILALFTLAVFLVRNTITHHAPKMAAHTESPFKALQSKWANLGSLGIFLYVGAEVCVISGMIFFLEQKQILNVPSQVAGFVGPIFMLFAMFGRFGGSVLLRYVKATTMLSIVAACAAALCGVVIATYQMPATPLGGSVTLPGQFVAPLTMGFVPGVAAILIGLFNSIMFPTIFTLTLERSSAPASATSGLMCMAICGGGFISILYGFTVDQFVAHFPIGARSLAFVVPMVCYLYVLWFSMAAKRAPIHAIQEDAVAGGH
ncbi:MFS transporter [Caulobacter sp. Root655]|uniref:MFS transporter n=1 Tax=Caulobacter sp. Root655 TaxID=1736578 RepID=UPI0009EA6D12|nr:sugar MFS transporter [Caulobacter sp. Root655]